MFLNSLLHKKPKILLLKYILFTFIFEPFFGGGGEGGGEVAFARNYFIKIYE
jgi:hypothetical protein